MFSTAHPDLPCMCCNDETYVVNDPYMPIKVDLENPKYNYWNVEDSYNPEAALDGDPKTFFSV